MWEKFCVIFLNNHLNDIRYEFSRYLSPKFFISMTMLFSWITGDPIPSIRESDVYCSLERCREDRENGVNETTITRKSLVNSQIHQRVYPIYRYCCAWSRVGLKLTNDTCEHRSVQRQLSNGLLLTWMSLVIPRIEQLESNGILTYWKLAGTVSSSIVSQNETPR